MIWYLATAVFFVFLLKPFVFADSENKLVSEIEAMTYLDRISLAIIATAQAEKIASELGQTAEASALKSKSDGWMEEMQKYAFGLILSANPESLVEVQAAHASKAIERFERITFGTKELLTENSVPLSIYTNPASMSVNDR